MIGYPAVVGLLSKHGNTAAGRAKGREEIRAAILATAEREARMAGRSPRCQHGDHRTIYRDGRGKEWPAGCQNTGSTCICECHDPHTEEQG
jgi:hypothetical protein